MNAILILASVLTAVSPDGRNEIRLDVGESLKYSVARDGRELLKGAEISMSFADGRTLGSKAELVSSEPFELTGTLETPIYRKSSVSLAAKGRRIAFSGGWGVELVARDDGVAYRFTTAFAEPKVKVAGEKAPVVLPSADLVCRVGQPDEYTEGPQLFKWVSNWEPIYTNMTAKALTESSARFTVLPLVVSYPDGTQLVVTEADARRYPGWLLRGRGKDLTLDSEFAPVPNEELAKGPYHLQIKAEDRYNYLAETDGRRAYPWRLFLLAESAAKLCENDAVYALAEPCRLEGDLSWIKPGKVAWDWYNDWNVSGVPFKAGCNTDTYLYYVDFAAANGIDYVIMDEGWSVKLDVLNVNPATDVPRIVAHAREKGVGIILWCGWAQLLGEGKAETVFAKYAKMGVVGFKIDGICRNDQFFVEFSEKTAALAAKYRLVIDYHGISKPTGLNRTYPNVLTFEGVHGLENAKWDKTTDFPANDLMDYFCRMTVGPMDYTPGAMINYTAKQYAPIRSKPGSESTRVHQMALVSLYESYLQMLADSPTQYLRNRPCLDFLAKIPTTWDETVGLAGDIDRYAVCARRKGEVWYLSAIGARTPQTVEVPLAFLGAGEWTAEVFEDGPNADRDAEDYVRKTATFSAKDKVTIRMAAGGGWTARLERK